MKKQCALKNRALTYLAAVAASKSNVTLSLTRETLDAIPLQCLTIKQTVEEGKLKIEGDGVKVMELLGMLDNFTPNFEIVAPNQAKR